MKRMTRSLFALVLLAGCWDETAAPTSSQPSAPPMSSEKLAQLLIPVGKNVDIVPRGQTGQIALVAPENAAIADVDGDGTDDVIALVHIKSQSDDQFRLVAFDGKAPAMLWASPRLEPVGARPSGARTMVFAGGGKVALTTGWLDVPLFEAVSGALLEPLMLAGIPGGRSCVDPADPSHVFLALLASSTEKSREVGAVLLDLAAAHATPTTRPGWCAAPPESPVRHCERMDRADVRCTAGGAAPAAPSFVPSYVLTAKAATVAIGNAEDESGKKDDSSGQPVVVRFDPATKKILWRHEIADAPKEGNLRDSHAIDEVDISPAGVLVVINRSAAGQIWAQRLIMLDLVTGAPRFERELSRKSTDAALAESPHVVHDVLYVPRRDALETWDPTTGALRRVFGSSLGTIHGSKLVPETK